MSGTSADGVDVAALHTDGESAIKYLGGSAAPYPDDVRNALLHLAAHDVPLVDVLRIEQQITKIHAHPWGADRAPKHMPGGTFPLGWTRRFGAGNVFTLLLGHDGKSFETPEFQKIVLNGVDWATQPVRD